MKTTKILKAEANIDKYLVPNLERALQIIEMLAYEPKHFTITEISNKLGIPKNSVFRIMKTLEKYDYLLELNRQYRLSAKLLSLGYANLEEINLIEKSIDVMRELKNESKETVLLGTILGLQGVVIDQVLGAYEITFSINIGHKFYLHTAAPGKAMLSFLPIDEQDHMLNSIEYKIFNNRTISNKTELIKTLEIVREKGYAVDYAERIEGLSGVASPIMNYHNYPVASIWITGPSFRMSENELERLGHIVNKYANKISQRLGYSERVDI